MAHVAVPDEPLPEATEALGDPSKSTADDGTPASSPLDRLQNKKLSMWFNTEDAANLIVRPRRRFVSGASPDEYSDIVTELSSARVPNGIPPGEWARSPYSVVIDGFCDISVSLHSAEESFHAAESSPADFLLTAEEIRVLALRPSKKEEEHKLFQFFLAPGMVESVMALDKEFQVVGTMYRGYRVQNHTTKDVRSRFANRVLYSNCWGRSRVGRVVNKVKQTAGRKQVGDKFIPKELNVSCFVCFFPVSADPMLRSLLAFWKIPIQGDSPGEPRLGAQ